MLRIKSAKAFRLVGSVFDLKNAIISFTDGYSNGPGAVDNVAGYAIAATTMAVKTFTTALATGDTFTLAGDTTIYTITAHTETLGATTSITFTPGLVVAAIDGEVITMLPHRIQVHVGDGNLQYTEKKARVYVLDRGKLFDVRNGNEDPMEVRIDFIWEFIRGATSEPPTVEDVLKKRGNAANWVTSSSDICQPYAVNILIEYEPVCPGVYWENILLSDFRYEELVQDLKNGTINVTGKCNVTEATSTRIAQPA